MAHISGYERLQIESLLQPRGRPRERNLGVFLMPALSEFDRIYDVAVGPAMRENDLNASGVALAFDSSASLSLIVEHIERAEVIVADVSLWNPDLAYVLGLCHGLGRCPILIAREGIDLPFNLMALRCLEYSTEDEGLRRHRENLARAIRVFLLAARQGEDKQ